jgi:hypothetical protein
LCLLAIALPVLASAGLDTVREGVRCPAVTRVLLGAAGLSLLALFLLVMTAGDDLERLTPIALCGLSAFAAYALLESRARGAISSNATAVLAILLAMWQFGHVAGTGWQNIEFGWPSLKKLADSADLAPVARSQRPARIANPDGSAGLQLGDWLGIEQFDGLTGGTENVVSAARHATARALGGAAFVIAENPQGPLAFQSLSGLKAYSAGKVFPRAWVVTHVDGLSNAADAPRRLDEPLANFRDSAFITGAPPMTGGCDKAGNAAPVAQEPARLRFRAALPCSGLVVIGQTYYPGWKAFVDGKPVKLYEADGFLDGVPAPAGRHVIELVYRPWTVWTGAAISAATALLLLIAYRRSSAQP